MLAEKSRGSGTATGRREHGLRAQVCCPHFRLWGVSSFCASQSASSQLTILTLCTVPTVSSPKVNRKGPPALRQESRNPLFAAGGSGAQFCSGDCAPAQLSIVFVSESLELVSLGLV